MLGLRFHRFYTTTKTHNPSLMKLNTKMPEKQLQITRHQYDAVANAILITGAPRSGTTLLGKIISTLTGIEYQFEPPTFYMITSLYASGKISHSTAKQLLCVYLYEDLLLESVHGRRANLRPQDDSLILNSISWQELHQRWSTIRNRADASTFVAQGRARLAVKMPNVFDAMPLINDVFAKGQTVIVARDGRSVVRSILKKGWVSNASLGEELWPHLDATGAPIPYWVPERFHNTWRHMSPETRACIMWATHAENGRKYIDFKTKKVKLVRYEELIEKPNETVTAIATAIGHKITDLTRRRTEEIRRPASMHLPESQAFANEVADEVDAEVLNWFTQVNRDWGYH